MISNRLEQKIARIVFLNKNEVDAKHRHFTFITRRNRILCWDFNKVYYTHPISSRFQHRFNDIHSELAAILRFPYRMRELKNYDFVNIRLRRDNDKFGLSRPCERCINMLYSFGVSEITYSNEIGGFSHERIY